MMKWNTLMTVTGILMAVVSLTGSIDFATFDGGNIGFQMIRNPFPMRGCVQPTINLYSPEEGETYYNNNVLLNFTTTGADTCYYRTSGSWNLVDCTYNKTRTFGYGEITLTVRGESGLCSSEESVTFTVYDYPSGGVFYEDILVFIPLFGLLLLFMFSRNDRRKEKIC